MPAGGGVGVPAVHRAGEPASGAIGTGERLQKVLARSGFGSRRVCENLIAAGKVKVNGEVAVLGRRIEAENDSVEVEGVPVSVREGLVHYLLHKPTGVVTTASDPHGRPTVVELLPAEPRVYPVGRLDVDSEGLLLLTNDGELTHRLTHPSFEVTKTYVAEVAGSVGRGVLRKLAQTGVDLGDPEPFVADAVRVLGSRKGPAGNRSVLELEVHEGPKHLVRRLLEAVDRPVVRLVRTGMGPLKLGRMATGSYRNLTQDEVDALYREVGL